MEQANAALNEAIEQSKKDKQAKWEAFCAEHKEAIARLPIIGGRRNVPCIWDKNNQQWHWLSRQQIRHIRRSHVRNHNSKPSPLRSMMRNTK